jgi:hypothetical protein
MPNNPVAEKLTEQEWEDVQRTEMKARKGQFSFTTNQVRLLCAALAEVQAERATSERRREALEAIIYASDGCQGHAGCNHSMEPWQKARALVAAQPDAPACAHEYNCRSCIHCGAAQPDAGVGAQPQTATERDLFKPPPAPDAGQEEGR